MLRYIRIVLATERWPGLLGMGMGVGERRIRVEASVHSRVIAHWARYREGRCGSRGLREGREGRERRGVNGSSLCAYEVRRQCAHRPTRPKGGEAVARAETRSKHVTFCLTKHCPIRQAHIWLRDMSEHRDRIRRSFLCLYEEMGKLLRGVVCVVLRRARIF